MDVTFFDGARNRFTNVIRKQKFRAEEGDACSNTACCKWLVPLANDCGCNQCLDEDFSQCCKGPGGKKKIASLTAADSVTNKHNFTVRLFDRSIETIHFKESAPLYAICREWVHDKKTKKDAYEKKGETGAKKDHKGDHNEPGVYHLPPPKPMLEVYDTHGISVSGRIPPPLTEVKDSLDMPSALTYVQIHAAGGDDNFLPSPAWLFKNHLERWQNTRQQWKTTIAQNEKRYDASFKIIRELYKDNIQPDKSMN